VDVWIEKTKPVALGLLGLKPWEFDRCTVGEIEDMLAGYHERQERLWEILARHALSTGQYQKGTTLQQVVGRDLLPHDARWQDTKDEAEEAVRHGTDEEWAAWEQEEAALERADQAKKGGLPTGRMTPEELEEARRQARS